MPRIWLSALRLFRLASLAGLVQARSGRAGGFDLVCEVRMLGRESDYVGLSLPQGLLD